MLNKKETRIYLFLIVDRKNKLKIKTDEVILPKYWDFKNQKVKPSYPGVMEINTRLNTLKSNVLLQYRRIINDEPDTSFDKIQKEIKDYVKNKHLPKQPKTELNQYIEDFVSGIEDGSITTTNGERFKKGTIKNYKGFKEQFRLYQEHIGRKLNFSDIDSVFYSSFVQYFNTKDYSPNTIGRHIKNLKTIVRHARENGLTNNVEVEKNNFRTIRVETQQVYLTEEELKKIYELDLSGKGNETLDEARDVFMLGVRLGQRFSDYHDITTENIKQYDNGIELIEIIQKKVGIKVYIPIHWQAREILEKYNYQLPKVYEQKLNARIKKVAEKAEIDTPLIIEKVQGGKKIRETVPKHQLIKTHTARRTGITLMYLAGIPTIDIMKISGHKTEREFLKYIKVSSQETAQNLVDHEYFKQA